MSRILCLRVICFLTLLVLGTLSFAHSAPHQAQETPPPPAQKTLRVAYIEGGYYRDFSGILVSLLQALEDRGLVAKGSVPVTGEETSIEGIWQWISAHAGGTKITFVADACYSGQWDQAKLTVQKDALLQRLREKKDIDLVLALGTMAGVPLATANITTPVMVLGAFDPVTTGIIASVEDSGRDNVFALVRAQRYYREVTLFHDIFKFTKLGIAYEDDPLGQAHIAYSQLEKAARDNNFELIACVRPYANTHYMDVPTMIDCNEFFARQGVDAVYMTIGYGEGEGRMGEVLRPLLKANLPTFAQARSGGVKNGILMSISEESFRGEGVFAATALANILAGQSPRMQKQNYEGVLSLAVNIRTAMRIGWFPPLSVLAAVDTIFER